MGGFGGWSGGTPNLPHRDKALRMMGDAWGLSFWGIWGLIGVHGDAILGPRGWEGVVLVRSLDVVYLAILLAGKPVGRTVLQSPSVVSGVGSVFSVVSARSAAVPREREKYYTYPAPRLIQVTMAKSLVGVSWKLVTFTWRLLLKCLQLLTCLFWNLMLVQVLCDLQ